MLPTPAIRRWSSRNALTGARRPRAIARSAAPVSSSESGSSPRRAAKNASRASGPIASSPVPNRRGSQKRSSCAPSSSTKRTRTYGVAGGGSSSSVPVIRKCMSRNTSPASSHTRYLPRRPSRSTRRPSTASRTASGASGRDHRGSRMSSSVSSRPSTAGASWRRIVSTSGSSGIASSMPPAIAPLAADDALARQIAGRAAGEPLERAPAGVGERAVVASAVVRAEDGEQRRILAGVVAVRRGGVDAVVGGEDQEVAGPEAVVEPLGDRLVDLAERLGEPADVVAVAVDLVGLDEVREDQPGVELVQELRRRGEPLLVGRRRVLAIDADAGEQVADLAHAVYRHAGVLHLDEIRAARRLEREVAAAAGAREVAGRAGERPRDHAPDGVLAGHHPARLLARGVKVRLRPAGVVRRGLGHGGSRRVEGP